MKESHILFFFLHETFVDFSNHKVVKTETLLKLNYRYTNSSL